MSALRRERVELKTPEQIAVMRRSGMLLSVYDVYGSVSETSARTSDRAKQVYACSYLQRYSGAGHLREHDVLFFLWCL